MKICILFITGRADHGGGPKHLDIVINYLSKSLYELFVACPKDDPYYYSWYKNDAVKKVIEIPHRQFSFKHLLKIILEIKKSKIKIVHSHGKAAGIYTRLIKVVYPRIKVIHSFHGVHIREYGPVGRWLYILIERTLVFLTDIFINVSQSEQNQCRGLGFYNHKKSTVIHNGIPPLQRQNFNKSNLGIPLDKFIITSITRYDFAKNMELALEIANLLKNNLGIAFVWIGDGPEKKRIKKKYEEWGLSNIVFIDFTLQIVQYLSNSDLYLSTSRWEGLPLALLEVCSLGVPAVVSNVVGNNEVIINNVNGYLFDIEKPEQAKFKILNLYSNQNIYKKYSQESIKIFEEQFSVDKMIVKMESLYKSLTN